MELPNLAGVATSDLVEKIGAGNFSAAYINWSRTLHLLRTHAPGWMPEAVPNKDGGLLHAAPVGCYLLIRFTDGEKSTPAVPQAVMDHRNAAIPHDKITARDITDTHRRGICMAAAMTFGLAYELWAKLPLESGYQAPQEPETTPRQKELADLAAYLIDCHSNGKDLDAIRVFYEPGTWDKDGPTATEEQKEVWGMLREHSKLRRILKENSPHKPNPQADRV